MIRIVETADEKREISRAVLEALTEWFGIPEARENYIAQSAAEVMFASFEGQDPLGFLCLKETGRDTLELSVMGVLKEHHRRGIGTELFCAAKALAAEKGYSFIQVKTVQMGRYEEYDRTNLFYKSLGFKELEVFPALWDEHNPCQIYVMALPQGVKRSAEKEPRSFGEGISRLGIESIGPLWELQKLYKAEIGEDAPDPKGKARLSAAIEEERILFFGAWEKSKLIGCCSVTRGFSTFDYGQSGVFEDFYILPEYRGRGAARRLVKFAFEHSGVSTLTVGCADCDEPMYRALGFTMKLGNLLAFE